MGKSQAQQLSNEKPLSETTASLLVLLVGALWGTIGIVARGLLNAGYHPLTLITWRLLIAGVVGQVILLFVKRRLTKPSMPVWFLFHGLIGSVMTMLLYFSAVGTIGVALTVSLHYSWPSFAVILGRLFFGEQITRKKVIALGIISAGAVIISANGLGANSSIAPLGVAAAILSGLTLASSGAFTKYELRFSSQLEVIVWPLFLAAIPCAIFAWLNGLLIPSDFTPYHFLQVVYLAVITTFLGNALYILALRSLQVGSASMLATIEPVAGVAFATLLLGETLFLSQGIGLVMIVSGVILVNYRRKKKAIPLIK